jgi:hypothetical protein
MGITIVDRLLEKKDRGNLTASGGYVYTCLFIFRDYSELEKPTQKDNFYHIVSFITNVEAFFRHLIAEIIDKNPEHLAVISKLLDAHLSKKDFVDSVIAVGTKKVSIGQIIGNAIPISSVEQIMGYFQHISNNKLEEKLIELSKRESFVGDYSDFNYEDAVKGLKTLFYLRHILCHENPDYRNYNEPEVSAAFYQSSGLIDLFGRLGDQILGIPEMRSQADQKEYLFGELEKSETELKDLITKIKENIKESDKIHSEMGLQSYRNGMFLEEFEKGQSTWEIFREIDSDSTMNQFYGGSIMGITYLGHKKFLTDQRIENLRQAWASLFDR